VSATLATGSAEYDAAACDYLTEAAVLHTRAGREVEAAAAAGKCPWVKKEAAAADTTRVSPRGGGARGDGDVTTEDKASSSSAESCQAAQARLSLVLASLQRLEVEVPSAADTSSGTLSVSSITWKGEGPPPPRGAAELGTLPLPPRVASDLRAYLRRPACKSAEVGV
jgi:hypothetical protein